MEYRINGNKLIVTVDSDERAELHELQSEPDFQSDVVMYEFLEPLVANSELQWIGSEDTGDMTEAPMLGILGKESNEESGPYGSIHVGHWDGKNWYQPIVSRWAFMNYQIKSPLNDLVDSGEAIFVS